MMHDTRRTPALFICLFLALIAPAQASSDDSFWERGTEMTDGWRWWHSLGPMYTDAAPWVYHPRHGWLWLALSDQAAVHAWSPDLGWLWLDLDAHPWLHSSERGWLYDAGTLPGGANHIYSQQLGARLQRQGTWLIPASETRLEALPLGPFSEPQPESTLNRPPNEEDWTALEALLPQIDGLNLATQQEAMQLQLDQVRHELETILEMNSLISVVQLDNSRYTEEGFRQLAAELGSAANRATLGLHKALTLLETFETRWGSLIERFYTVSHALDTMDQRLFRQRERLLGNQVEALRSLSEAVQAQIGDAHYRLSEWETPDVESWRISADTRAAIAEDADLSARAHRFLTENTLRLNRFEAAHTMLTGVGDAPGVSGQYAHLREQMDAATEVVNTLSALYWHVQSALEQGGPYRLGDGSGNSYGSVDTIAIGGLYRYSAHLAEIRDAFSALDENLGSIVPRPQPLLRLENLEHLQNEESLLQDTVGQIDSINHLLELPVPDPVLPYLNWIQ